jgi:hypothetical protein
VARLGFRDCRTGKQQAAGDLDAHYIRRPSRGRPCACLQAMGAHKEHPYRLLSDAGAGLVPALRQWAPTRGAPSSYRKIGHLRPRFQLQPDGHER